MDEDELDIQYDDEGPDIQYEPPGDASVPEGMMETGNQRTVLPEITMSPGQPDRVASEPAVIEREVIPDTLRNRLSRYVSGEDPEALQPDSWPSIGGFELPSPASLRRSADASTIAGRLQALVPTANTNEPIVGRDLRHQAGGRAYADAMTLGFADDAMRLRDGEGAGERQRQLQQMSAEQDPTGSTLGAIGGQVHLAALPGGQSTALRRIGMAGLQGVGLGALRGAGESESTDVEGLLQDVGRGAATEGVMSAGTAGLFEGGGAVAQGVARRAPEWLSSLREAAARNRISAAGIRYAQDTRRLPRDVVQFADDLRETGISRGLRSVSAAGERGAEVRRASNDEITRILASADEAANAAPVSYREGGGVAPGRVDAEALAAEIERMGQRYDAPDSANTAARERLTELARQLRERAENGGIPLEVANRVRSTLGNPRNFVEGQPWNVLAQSQRDLHSAVRGSMGDALERVSPEMRTNFDTAMRRVHAGRLAEQGAGRIAERNASNRLISPSDYIAATGAGLAGAGSGADLLHTGLAAGAGFLANRVVRGRERAISATALEALLPTMERLGPRAAQWAQQLRQAQLRGQPAVSAQHYLLSRSNPEYRAMVQRLMGMDDDESDDSYEPVLQRHLTGG